MKNIFIHLIFVLLGISAAKGEKLSCVLIVFGSQYGSTAEIACKMKVYLEVMNISCDTMKAMSKIVDFSKYELVVIGSGIYGGVPHKSVREFITINREVLNKKKVAVFAVCGFKNSKRDRWRRASQFYADSVASGLTPLYKNVFAGKIPDLGWFKNFLGWTLVGGVKRMDFRDWEEIKKWTVELAK